jgi:acyl carrier protein
MDSLEKKVIEMIAEHLAIDPSQIKSETSFEKDLKVDSMDAMDLLVAINEEFQVRIPPEKMEKIQTIQDMVNAIKEDSAGD